MTDAKSSRRVEFARDFRTAQNELLEIYYQLRDGRAKKKNSDATIQLQGLEDNFKRKKEEVQEMRELSTLLEMRDVSSGVSSSARTMPSDLPK